MHVPCAKCHEHVAVNVWGRLDYLVRYTCIRASDTIIPVSSHTGYFVLLQPKTTPASALPLHATGYNSVSVAIWSTHYAYGMLSVSCIYNTWYILVSTEKRMRGQTSSYAIRSGLIAA